MDAVAEGLLHCSLVQFRCCHHNNVGTCPRILERPFIQRSTLPEESEWHHWHSTKMVTALYPPKTPYIEHCLDLLFF